MHKLQFAGLSYAGISVRTHIYSIHSQKLQGANFESLRDLDTFLMQGTWIMCRDFDTFCYREFC